jgi:hypothetical protein
MAGGLKLYKFLDEQNVSLNDPAMQDIVINSFKYGLRRKYYEHNNENIAVISTYSCYNKCYRRCLSVYERSNWCCCD